MPFNRCNLGSEQGLIDDPVLGQELTLRQVLLNAAKNALGPSAAGTSSLAEGLNTAEPDATTTRPAPAATPAPKDGSAPTASTP
jgi:hypothetical protein